MEVAAFFVDFHHFLSIFTIYALLSLFTFCRDLHTFSANFFSAKIASPQHHTFFACMRWWWGWWGCWHDDAERRHLRNRRQRGWTEREGSGEARRGWRIRPQRRQGLNIFDSLIWNLFVTLIVNLSGVRSLESFSIRPDLGWSGWWSLSKRTTASARG